MTINEIRAYLLSQDSIEDALHNLSDVNISRAYTRQINQTKLDHLRSFNVEIQEYDLEDGYVSFSSDYECNVEFDAFDADDTFETIYRMADKYSCCGDILDEDYMICPTCREHC